MTSERPFEARISTRNLHRHVSSGQPGYLFLLKRILFENEYIIVSLLGGGIVLGHGGEDKSGR